MFYCNECAKKYGYPETISKSDGNCECCGKNAECNDRSSSLLPMPKASPDDKAKANKSQNGKRYK